MQQASALPPAKQTTWLLVVSAAPRGAPGKACRSGSGLDALTDRGSRPPTAGLPPAAPTSTGGHSPPARQCALHLVLSLPPHHNTQLCQSSCYCREIVRPRALSTRMRKGEGGGAWMRDRTGGKPFPSPPDHPFLAVEMGRCRMHARLRSAVVSPDLPPADPGVGGIIRMPPSQ